MLPNWWQHSLTEWQELSIYFGQIGADKKELLDQDNWQTISIGRSNFSYCLTNKKTKYFIQITNQSNNQFLPYERFIDLNFSIDKESYRQLSQWLVRTLYQSKSVKVQSWFESIPLEIRFNKELKVVESIAEFLAKLHGSQSCNLAKFDLIKHLIKYQKIAISKTRNQDLRKEIDACLELALSLLNNYQSYAPCHYDLNLNNILIDEKELEIKVIDWEYFCIGDPMIDVTAVISNFGLSDTLSSKFISYYHQIMGEQSILNIDTSDKKLKEMSKLNNCIYKLWEYGQ